MQAKLVQLILSPDFPGKISDDQIEQYQQKISRFRDIEITAIIDRIHEETAKKKKSGKNILISQIEDITALTKMEILLTEQKVAPEVINLLLTLLINKSSNFSIPIFDGKVDDLLANSVENGIINIVLEKSVSEKSRQVRTKEMKDLFDRKIRDTETFVHLTEIIDSTDLNSDETVKTVFMVNLLAEAMKRDETMRKSESISMKDLINLFLLSKLQNKLAALGYPNETIEGIIINRLSQSNNIRRQFRILDQILKDTLEGNLDIDLGSKTEKLEWLKLINELEINISLSQYEEKLRTTLDETLKTSVHGILMTDNIADQTIASISFARRLDNPDESLHEASKLVEVARETQYLTSMIFRVKGFQIKEVYEFVELIGELDIKNERYHKVVDFFQHELPCIDKSVLKEDDPDVKKAALASRYLSARLMSLFGINPEFLNMSLDYVSLNHHRLPPELRENEDSFSLQVDHFSELRKRIGFFNKAERAFMTMNQVEAMIQNEMIELTRDNIFRIMDMINDTELSIAVGEYVRAGTITRGQDDPASFSAAYAEPKIKTLFQVQSIRMIEKEAVEKNIIPESILLKAEEDGSVVETLLDIKNYAVYLVTRRFDKPEYPRHLQRALNLILALVQDAIGWRHFENSQIRAKQEIAPLIDEYYLFLSKILQALAEDKNPAHEEIISKLRDDDFFAITDNKDSLEGGKKSAPQVRTEFYALMHDTRFQEYVAKAFLFAEATFSNDWQYYKGELEQTKQQLNLSLTKTCAVIDKIIEDLKTDVKHLHEYKDHIQILQNKYLSPLEKLEFQLNTHRKPASIIKIEYDRIVNSEKFKVFLKHTFELSQTAKD